MKKLVLFFILFFFSLSVLAELPDSYYRVGSGTEKDFFAYHRPSNTVTLFEVGSFAKHSGGRKYSYTNYFIDLKEKSVLRELSGKARLSGCFSGRLMRHPDGVLLASQNNNTKMLSILERNSGKCRQVKHELAVMKFTWSDDGKWLELMDRATSAFYRLDPEVMQFEMLDRKGSIDSFAWSQELDRSLFVYRTNPVNDVYETSKGYSYYYVDNDGVQQKVEGKYPMTNPDGDVYFYTEFEDEQSPVTTFVDVKSGKTLVRQPEFYLAFNNRYALWLENDWVYFEGASGVLNYRTGEFVSFGTELTPSVVPFSVSEGRYAMMYLRGDDRLMVYDLEKREYIESYTPFWREASK